MATILKFLNFLRGKPQIPRFTSKDFLDKITATVTTIIVDIDMAQAELNACIQDKESGAEIDAKALLPISNRLRKSYGDARALIPMICTERARGE